MESPSGISTEHLPNVCCKLSGNNLIWLNTFTEAKINMILTQVKPVSDLALVKINYSTSHLPIYLHFKMSLKLFHK